MFQSVFEGGETGREDNFTLYNQFKYINKVKKNGYKFQNYISYKKYLYKYTNANNNNTWKKNNINNKLIIN